MCRPLNAAILLFVVFLTSACVGGGSIPEEHFYRLPSSQPATAENSPVTKKSVEVSRFEVSGLLHERAMVYLDVSQPNAIRSYHYHQWQDPPGALVRDHLIGYLRDANLFPDVFAVTAGVRGDLRLLGKLTRFERELDGDRSTAVVEIEFTLLQGRQPLLGPQRYQARIESGNRSLYSSVEAFGAALQRIYDHLAADLRAATRG